MDIEIEHREDLKAVNHRRAFLIPAVVEGRLIIFTPQIVKQVKKVQRRSVKSVKTRNSGVYRNQAWIEE